MNSLVAGVWRDKVPILLILGFVVVTSFLRLASDLPPVALSSYLTNSALLLAGIVVGGLIWICVRLAWDRPSFPMQYYITGPNGRLTLNAALSAIPILFALYLFMPNFAAAKSMIGFFQPYEWDPYFAELDYYLHGVDAWKLLQPIFGKPVITYGLAIVYQLWIFFIYIAFPLVCMWRCKMQVRQQMILAFALCWIVIGAIMAHIFASVGPCFLEPITGDNRFREQMDYLTMVDRQYPLLVLDIQQRLLESYLTDDHGLGRGISAMPSMHVSIAMLFAIFGWHVSKIIGLLLTAVFFLILIGSVHLGYHYAVDGYVAIVATFIIWMTTGWIVNKRPTREHSILQIN
ncbi:phosphatase PAP2 family protein [Tritonibacter scottomollicae]|uniref:phosphatase PAP2 family protein n=1 Tax=Tritonibacter scottomollicae TaxID=483013 RepID=UPI003AA9E171